jgi:hypothetical protein
MNKKNLFSGFRSGRTGVVAILLGITLVISACGGAPAAAGSNAVGVNPSAGASSGSKVAGGLLSKEEVGQILGQPVVDVRNTGNGTIVVYQTKSLILEVLSLKTGGISAADYMKSVRATNGNAAVVAGVGDEAFYNTTAYRIFFVRKGESVYSFGLRSEPASSVPSDTDIKAMEKSVAELFFSKL